MHKHLVAYSAVLGIAIGAALTSPAAIAAGRTACQILPATQAQRIFGSAVSAKQTSQSQGGNTSTICGYSSTATGAEHASALQVVYAKSVSEAVVLEKQIRQVQGASPAVRIGRKGNVIVKVEADIPPDRIKVSALFKAAMRNL